MTYQEAVQSLYYWQHHNGDSFNCKIFELLHKADSENKMKIAVGWPELTKAYLNWHNSPTSDGVFRATWSQCNATLPTEGPAMSEASEIAEEIVHLLGVGHVNDIKHLIYRACQPLRNLLPATFYADRPLTERIKFMVEHWQKAIVACQKADEELTAKDTEIAQLTEALRGLYAMVEAGTLVRDTSHDHDPKWYLTAMELTQALAKAQAALATLRTKDQP